MLRIIKGNIFTSDCQTLVNTVNCVGVMGAGIALEFKLRCPEMFGLYVERCRSGELTIGKPWLYKPQEHQGRWVLNFPTKKDWKYPSKETYLHRGLKHFVAAYRRQGITSIAFPILGAQNGRIPEKDSVRIMTSYLYQCDLDIEIYRYDPDANDDLYENFKQRFTARPVAAVAAATGLRHEQISVMRHALTRREIKTISQLAAQKGIGGKTLEKIFTYLTAPPPQPDLFLTRPQALNPAASQEEHTSMGTHKHDWRTKQPVYVAEDAELSHPDRYEWNEPSGEDKRIITRGIVRQGARVDIMTGKAIIKLDGGEQLDTMIKEPDPTAIFLDESRSAWERRQNLLAEESASIRQTGQFSIDTKESDFLQASQSAVIMAMTALECYANHQLNTEKKSQKSIVTKVNESLPALTGRKKLSANPDTKALWKKFQAMNKLRDHLVHATAKKMERVNVHRPEWVNTWENVAQIDCPHEIVLQLIDYFEGEPSATMARAVPTPLGQDRPGIGLR